MGRDRKQSLAPLSFIVAFIRLKIHCTRDIFLVSVRFDEMNSLRTRKVSTTVATGLGKTYLSDMARSQIDFLL